MLTVIRRSHLKANPQLRSAARMRPSLSLIEESGSPSIVKRGKPEEVSASTRMRWASAPTTAAVSDVASMTLSPAGGRPARGGGRVPPVIREATYVGDRLGSAIGWYTR